MNLARNRGKARFILGMQMHPLKNTELVIIYKFSPYIYLCLCIHETIAPVKFALPSPLALNLATRHGSVGNLSFTNHVKINRVPCLVNKKVTTNIDSCTDLFPVFIYFYILKRSAKLAPQVATSTQITATVRFSFDGHGHLSSIS